MSANTLKKVLLAITVVALAVIALIGTAVAVVALAGGLESNYIAGRPSAAIVSTPSAGDLGVTGRGYYPASAAYGISDELE
jgi:hypothetical protein